MVKDWALSSYDQEWSKDVHIVALIWHNIRNSRQCNTVRKKNMYSLEWSDPIQDENNCLCGNLKESTKQTNWVQQGCRIPGKGLPWGLGSRVHPPTQETEIWSLIWEDPTCHRAPKPMPQPLMPARHTVRAPQQEKPPQWDVQAINKYN